MERHETNKETIAILKAARKKSREEEIRLFGKQIRHERVEESKKLYTRKEKHKKQIE